MTVEDERVSRGVLRCPFVQALSANWGEKAARRTAANALAGVKGVASLDPATDEAFRMAHGPEGIHPIVRGAQISAHQCPGVPEAPLVSAQDDVRSLDTRQTFAQKLGLVHADNVPYEQREASIKTVSASFASISLSGFWVRTDA
jgi:hypothetical protein